LLPPALPASPTFQARRSPRSPPLGDSTPYASALLSGRRAALSRRRTVRNTRPGTSAFVLAPPASGQVDHLATALPLARATLARTSEESSPSPTASSPDPSGSVRAAMSTRSRSGPVNDRP